MGKYAQPESLLFSHLRQRVLGTLLLHPKKDWYLTELVRHLSAAQAHLHRELSRLVDAGVLQRRVEGRQVYYSPDPNCPYLCELTALMRKTMGLPNVLAEALRSKREKIDCAFIYGSVAKGAERATSDIDLMIVGNVTISDLLPAIARAEKQTGREINPTIYPAKELAEKYRHGNHFVRAVLADPAKIFLIGSRDDLAKASHGRTHKAAQDKQGRNRGTPGRRRSQA
ncbi:MAG: nucleotidyltransferase domain-containing protein [Singulisphaera sp.]